MDIELNTKYFLGPGCFGGQQGLYNVFADTEKGDFLFVLKGGPGCGKSDFLMKIAKAAQEAGMQTECILCTETPESLEGVFIPGLGLGYVDGSSGGILGTRYTGVSELYVDFSPVYDTKALRGHLDKLIYLHGARRAELDRAHDAMEAAKSLDPRKLPGFYGEAELEKVSKRARSAISRELPKKKSGRRDNESLEQIRFISAFTSSGVFFCQDTIDSLCSRIYTLDNNYGLADEYLFHIAKAAKERRIRAVICPDPLEPDFLEAIILPELQLGFLAISSQRGYSGKEYRHIRLDALIPPERIKELRPRYRGATKLHSELLEDARLSLEKAGELNKEIEMLYKPHINLELAEELAGEHIKKILY